ncbi:O-antigen ligase family protein [Janibacter indicus]|uniref:O-antigen ligase family protein n=1 Tax=Janibacter indicus TaxID=857417 RepID=UPI003D9AA974
MGIALTLGAVSAKLLRNQFQVPLPKTAIAVTTTATLGFLSSSGFSYADSKRWNLGVTALVFFAGLWLINEERKMTVWIALHIVMAVAFALTATQDAAGRLGLNTITTGRLFGISVIVFAAYALFSSGKPFHRAVATLSAFLFVGTLIATGSRGPFISAAIVVIVLGLTQLQGMRVVRAAGTALLVALGYQLLLSADDAGAARIIGTLDGSINGTESRTPRWTAALENIPAHPFGIGWGNFREIVDVGITDRQYAHNLLLESWVEAGWLFGLAVMVACLVALRTYSRHRFDTPGLLTFGVFAFLLLNAMVSGDVNDNRPLIAMLGAGLAFVPGSTSRKLDHGGETSTAPIQRR